MAGDHQPSKGQGPGRRAVGHGQHCDGVMCVRAEGHLCLGKFRSAGSFQVGFQNDLIDILCNLCSRLFVYIFI